MSGQVRRWAYGLLVGILILSTGCATTPTAPIPAPPPVPTSAQAGNTTIVAIAPPAKQCCPHPSLLDFLGITQIGKGIVGLTGRLAGRLRARLGMRFPGLESKPALVEITDPANLGENASPAQQSAAKAKAEEDAAPQKAKALRYLATLGCGGCYPDVEEALLAALKDCTEVVRFEAVSAIRDTTFCPCVYCNEPGCCSPAVQKALRRAAYEMNDNGCYVEPSARVRRVARIALVQCSCVPLPIGDESEAGEAELPSEGPSGPPPADVTDDPSSGDGVQLASYQGEKSAVADLAPDRLLATVNGQPIFMHHVAEHVTDRFLATPLEERTAVRRQQIINQEVERAIDDLLLHQLRSAGSAFDMDSYRTGTAKLPDMSTFPQARSENREWLAAQLGVNRNLDPAEVQAYYQQHADDGVQPASVRWEEVTIRFGEGLTRNEGYQIAVYLRSRMLGLMVDPPAHFQAELVSSKTHTWRTLEQIRSPLIGTTVFALPPGQISPVLEEAGAWHLVRVLERQSGQRKSLEEMTSSIHNTLLQQRIRAAEHAYFTEARGHAIVWKP